jgi:hypothetical protein
MPKKEDEKTIIDVRGEDTSKPVADEPDRPFPEDAPWVGAELAWRNSFLPPPHEDIHQYPPLVTSDAIADEERLSMSDVEFETVLSSLAPPPIPELRPTASPSRWPTSPLRNLSYIVVGAAVGVLGWVIVDTRGAVQTPLSAEITPGASGNSAHYLYIGDATVVDDETTDQCTCEADPWDSQEMWKVETVDVISREDTPLPKELGDVAPPRADIETCGPNGLTLKPVPLLENLSNDTVDFAM